MIRIVIAAAIAMALAAPLADAQGGTGAQQAVEHCKNLEQMFEVGSQGRMTAKKMAEAQALYSQGMGFCNTYQQKQGIKSLKTGLERIGVKPRSIVYSSTYSAH